MFICARSEHCDVGPIYTITITERIRIYPGKLKFILVKISPDPGRLHGKHAKETLENTNVFHNVFKVWMKCGNTMEKLWKPSSTVFSLFHCMELKLNVELVW